MGKRIAATFEQSKPFLKSPKLLIHRDDKKEVALACDAFQYGLGAVPPHKMRDGSEHPILFAFRDPNKSREELLERESTRCYFWRKEMADSLH